ncbi:MAG: hypothetical protein HY749_18690 [Gammaproteobacteria bacterium]|nr:hypothetical protein [Gammaproteobacteria bacterium]
MITTLDDYPIHQTSLPVAVPATSDRNFYDRFWFNGFVGDGSLYFSVAMGFYPNRGVHDGGFSVLVDGVQYSLHLSGELPIDRAHTALGPLRIETVVPMRRHRVVVDDAARGFRADLSFEAATGAHEEARQTFTDGLHVSMDVTRVSQFGTWSGFIEIKGRRIDVDPRVTNGTRDRSWGVRPCGEPGGKRSRWATQLYFGWTQTFWRDFVLHGVFFCNADGAIDQGSAAVVPRVARGDTPVFARDTGEIVARPVAYQFDYRPGTRRIRRATTRFEQPDGRAFELEFEPLVSFQMAGLGYGHPDWGHGCWKGGYVSGEDVWTLEELDLTQVHLFHVQQVCKVTLNGEQTSCGILEHACIGPHAPSGFEEFADVYRPR